MVTTWRLFQCGGGAQWSSTTEDNSGEICTFSGCNCETKVTLVKTTQSRGEASDWFRRPVKTEAKQCQQ